MSAKLTAKDYDECEKLYCGTWSLEWEENVEEFLRISGMPKQMASFFRDEKLFSIKRDGNTFVETMKIDGVDTEIRLPPFDNEIEWKDKDQDPIFHVKVLASFKDGAWYTKFTPLKEDGFKPQIIKSCVEGDKFNLEQSLLDVPGAVTMKRRYKRL